jgi:hypothetical protein
MVRNLLILTIIILTVGQAIFETKVFGQVANLNSSIPVINSGNQISQNSNPINSYINNNPGIIPNPYNNGINNSSIGSIGQFNGGGSNCGLQIYINAGLNGSGNSVGGNTATNSETSVAGINGYNNSTGTNNTLTNTNTYSLQLGLVFNQQQCTDQTKLQREQQETQLKQTKLQIQGQTEQTRLQTQSQRDISCIGQRGSIFLAHPDYTKEQLDKVCEVAPITKKENSASEN